MIVCSFGVNSLAHRVVSAKSLDDLPDMTTLETDLVLDAIVGIKVRSVGVHGYDGCPLHG